MQIMVMRQIILDSSVSFIRALSVDFLYNLCNPFVCQLSGTLFPAPPTVVGCSGDMQQLTGCLYGIVAFFAAFLDCQIDMGLLYLAQRPLLSISSNFFSRRFSISNIFNLCLSCSIST